MLENVLPMRKPQDEKPAKSVCKDVGAVLRKFRQQRETNWKNYEDAYHGDIWYNTSDYRPYINDVFRIVQSELPVLTDSLPSTAVTVNDSAFQEQGKNLNHAVEWVQKDQAFDLMAPEVILDSLITGNGYIYAYYDPHADNGEGQIKHEVVPWRYVWLSGEASKIDDISKARWQVPRTKQYLKMAYPKHAEKIDKLKPSEKTDDNRDRSAETTDVGYSYGRRSRPKEYNDDDVLLLDHYYIRDYSTVPIDEEQSAEEMQEETNSFLNEETPDVNKWQDHEFHIEGHMVALTDLYGQIGLTPEVGIEAAMQAIEEIAATSPEAIPETLGLHIRLLETHIEEHKELANENPEGHRPKYEHGWRCIEKVADCILYDDSPRWDHGIIPLVPFYCYRNGTIYADGEIANIIDAERMKAVLQYKEYKGLQKVANPCKLVDEKTGLTEDDITNEDGQVFVLPEGTTIRNMEPGQINPQLGSFIDRMQQSQQDVSGVVEATQGKMPGPNAAAMTVHKTQQQAIGRMRLKDRQNQGYSIKRLGKIDASLVIQYWHSEKILRLENKGGDYQQIVFDPMEMKDLKWEMEISPGSMAGVDKDAFSSILFQFLQAGHITFDEMLQVGEFQKAEKIREMVSGREDLSAQLQQSQMENLKIKAQMEQLMGQPLLSNEERAALEEVQLNEANAALSGSQ